MVLMATTPNSVNKKSSKGRKKIEIKKIQETNTRQVTFSKRRSGIFKKASELSFLTDTEIAVLVNSPGGRIFAYGDPNPDNVINRYNLHDANTINIVTTQKYSQPSVVLAGVKQLNEHYVEFSRELEMEKKRGRDLINPRRSGGGSRWYEEEEEEANNVDGMDMDELEKYVCSLEQFKKKVSMRADELIMMINRMPSLSGSNVIDPTGFNDNYYVQTMVDVPATGHCGFDYHHVGEIGRF